MAYFQGFEHLKLQLDEIKSTTNNFGDNNVIGKGGFGKVYRGEISHSKGQSIVAFKHLDCTHGQGDPEFWKEIMMLSRYTHKNLVSLLGFCNDGVEKILAYEYASHGSLDRCISSTDLMWTRRLKICLGAASGLSYLQCCGGMNKGRLYGFGSMTNLDFVLTGSPGTPSTGRSYAFRSSYSSAEEVQKLMEDQKREMKRQLEERRREMEAIKNQRLQEFQEMMLAKFSLSSE